MFKGSPFSLFDEPDVPGIGYREDYITPEEEAALIRQVDRQPWSHELLRRRQWYGWAPDGSLASDPREYRPQPMPYWLSGLAERLHQDGHFKGVPRRVLINDYQPGQGIGAHRDRDIDHIKSVAIISLSHPIVMEFTRMGHATRSRCLYPRSLLTMRGEAREKWLHGITARKSDRVGGLVVPRGRRLSLTFRYIEDGGSY